jgi:hypothetical protein
MDPTFLQFVNLAKMTILIVNVGTSEQDFQKYFQLVTRNTQVALSDLPPPVSKEATCTSLVVF